MAATVFRNGIVQILKEIFRLGRVGDVRIYNSTVDPTVTATAGDPGSILINRTTGFVYKKFSSGVNTNWRLMSADEEENKIIATQVFS